MSSTGPVPDKKPATNTTNSGRLKKWGPLAGVTIVILALLAVIAFQGGWHTKLAELLPAKRLAQEVINSPSATTCTDPAPYGRVVLKLSPNFENPHLASVECATAKPDREFTIRGFGEKVGFESLAKAAAFVQHARTATGLKFDELRSFIAPTAAEFGAMTAPGANSRMAAAWNALKSDQRTAIVAIREAGVTAGGLPLLYAGVATGKSKP